MLSCGLWKYKYLAACPPFAFVSQSHLHSCHHMTTLPQVRTTSPGLCFHEPKPLDYIVLIFDCEAEIYTVDDGAQDHAGAGHASM